MDTDLVLYDLTDGVATLTLNRPERHNAWTIGMQRRYYELLEQCEHDPAVRVIIVTGAGDSFCPGADSQELEVYTQTGEFNPEASTIEQPDSYPYSVRKPLIAAINGRCAGFGLVQTLMCDIRFGAAGARLSTAFARRGLPALHGIAYLLPRLIGLSRATELIMSGRTFTMEEAHSLGMIHQIAAADALLGVAQEYAAELAVNCAPNSWVDMKAQLRNADLQNFEDAVGDATAREAAALSSPDFAEGVNSFIERRQPDFPPARLR